MEKVYKTKNEYRVTYSYCATGMDGRSDERDYGRVKSMSAGGAKNIIVNQILPKGEHSRKDRAWFKGCLTAEQI